MPKLIIIRGPSGAGKSTVAKTLLAQCAHPTLLVCQDQARYMFSNWKMPAHTASKDLITQMVLSGLNSGCDVIFEGILDISTHKNWFDKILAEHSADNYWFYLDVSYEETQRRHKSRPEKDEFGEEEMKRWWSYASKSEASGETVILEGSTLEQTIQTISRVAGLKLQKSEQNQSK